MSSTVVSEVAGLQTSKYANIGGLAILIFDYCITFQDEVQWIWFRPWNLVRIIFTISRYMPFIGTGITAYAVLRGVSSPCAPALEGDIIYISSMVAAEGLLLFRIWAFWQKSKRLLIGLLLYGLLTIMAIALMALGPFYSGAPSLSVPASAEAILTICPFEASRNYAVVYSFLAAYEIVILVLTVYKRCHDYRYIQNSIINDVYNDNMVYILCIIAITVTNIVVCAAFPIVFSDMFDTLQLAIHSTLASRILFRLRSSDEKISETPAVFVSEIRFQRSSDSGTSSRV